MHRSPAVLTEVLLPRELFQAVLQRGRSRLVRLQGRQIEGDVPERVYRRRHVAVTEGEGEHGLVKEY